MLKSCAGCEFFQPNEEGKPVAEAPPPGIRQVGICRAAPPQFVELRNSWTNVTVGAFPPTDGKGCGSYRDAGDTGGDVATPSVAPVVLADSLGDELNDFPNGEGAAGAAEQPERIDL